MRIGTVARRTGVSHRLLRYYEQQGLLHPARGSGGYREYTERDVRAVSHIRSLLAAGLPTAAIAEVLHCVHEDGAASTCPAMKGRLRAQRARLAETIMRMEQARHRLDDLLAGARD